MQLNNDSSEKKHNTSSSINQTIQHINQNNDIQIVNNPLKTL